MFLIYFALHKLLRIYGQDAVTSCCDTVSLFCTLMDQTVPCCLRDFILVTSCNLGALGRFHSQVVKYLHFLSRPSVSDTDAQGTHMRPTALSTNFNVNLFAAMLEAQSSENCSIVAL